MDKSGHSPSNLEQLRSRSYVLPVDDAKFLLRDEMRATRVSFGRIVSLRGGALEPRDRWRDSVIATSAEKAWQVLEQRGLHAHAPA